MYIKISAVAVALLQVAQLAQAATSESTTNTETTTLTTTHQTTTNHQTTTTHKITTTHLTTTTTAATNKATTTTAAPATTAAAVGSSSFAIGDYWKNFNSLVDPLNIQIASIPQTTSDDPTTECTYYQPPTNFVFNAVEWPNLWQTATSNGMSETAEFKAVYNAIDWTKAPNIAVRKSDANGALVMTGYDQVQDPDCWWSASICTKPKLPDVNEDIYMCPEPDTWGLTYDDGPNCSHNAFYDYLQEQNLKASMFYIGSNVVNWPYGAQRGQRDGHHLADHTWSHQLMTTLTNTEVLAELYYTQKAIKMVTGVTPKYWRPAFGDVDDRVRWIATQLGMTTILWNLDTDDWAAGSSETMAQVEQAYNDFIAMGSNGTFQNSGQITLTHEIDNTTMGLAIDMLPKIKAAYKNVLDVATCMNITNPYQETNVVFAAFGSPAANAATNTTASAAASSVAAVAGNAASAGIQITPNNLAIAAFAVAAYFF